MTLSLKYCKKSHLAHKQILGKRCAAGTPLWQITPLFATAHNSMNFTINSLAKTPTSVSTYHSKHLSMSRSTCQSSVTWSRHSEMMDTHVIRFIRSSTFTCFLWKRVLPVGRVLFTSPVSTQVDLSSTLSTTTTTHTRITTTTTTSLLLLLLKHSANNWINAPEPKPLNAVLLFTIFG